MPVSNREVDTVTNGWAWFYAQGKLSTPPGIRNRLGDSEWLYLDFGYGFYLSQRDVDNQKGDIPLKIQLYARFSWRGNEDDDLCEYSEYLTDFPSDVRAMELLNRCFKGARSKAMRRAAGAYREAIRVFNIPRLP
jgi:hypothetical protein